jgi:hypothetical protein
MASVFWRFILVFTLCSACGREDSYRPLEIEIYGVSARATSVNLKVFAFDSHIVCAELSQDTVTKTEAHMKQTWLRSEMSDRSWVLPKLETEFFTMAVYTQDEAAQIMQYSCRQMNYEDIGKRDNGVLSIVLSARKDL